MKGQFQAPCASSGVLTRLLTYMYWYGFGESFLSTFQQQVRALDTTKTSDIARKKLQFVLIGRAEELW